MAYGTVNADKIVNSDGITSGGLYGFKNRIINGAMGIWQRGTSGFTTSGNYAADRWSVSTGGTITTGAQSSDVPSGFKYSFNIAGTGTPNIVQKIESLNCTDLVGQSVTISFWAKQTVGAGSNSLYVYLAYANSADTFSGITQIGSTVTFTGTSAWAQYTTTFTNLPAGAANGLYLSIASGVSGSSTNYFTGVQLEKGSTATSFDYRPYGTELALCQRYYYQATVRPLSVYSGTAYLYSGAMSLPVTMRSAPTLASGATFTVGGGNAGTVALYAATGANASADAVVLYNSANNWTASSNFAVTAGLSAEL